MCERTKKNGESSLDEPWYGYTVHPSQQRRTLPSDGESDEAYLARLSPEERENVFALRRELGD